jgi:uncharacterized membrane protein
MSRWLLASIGLTGLAVGASLVAYYGFYDRLPDRVPIHWDWKGQADRWVERDGALSYLLLLPGLMAGTVLLTLVLPWLSPRHFQVEPFRATYDYIMFLIVAMFAYLHLVILAASFEKAFDLTRVLLGGMFLFLAALGNVLGKVQRNFWIGVRTPWTLASDIVWNRTHRLAAWLFVAGGLLAFLATVANLPVVVALVLFGVPALVPVFYSLILYKRLEKEGRL